MARDTIALPICSSKRLRITSLPLLVVPRPIGRPAGMECVLTNLGRFIKPQGSIHDTKKPRLLNPPPSGNQILQQWAAWEQDVALDNSLVTHRELAPGEWVRICERGIYHSDVGVIHSATSSPSGALGYVVLLIPCLPCENDKALIQEITKATPTLSMKRKHMRGKVTKIETNMFKYKCSVYSYGLCVKFFPETSLDSCLPSLSSNLRLMFIESQHPFVVLVDLPCVDHWSFEEREVVVVCDVPSLAGAIISANREQQSCVVEFGGNSEDNKLVPYSELLTVPMRKLEKVVRVGDYVNVVAGMKKGEEGLVTEKNGTNLHIFHIEPSLCELGEPSSAGNQKGKLFRAQKQSDLVVHMNSVKLGSPPFTLDHGPWFNVRVVVNTVKGVSTFEKKQERVKVHVRDAYLHQYHGLHGQVKHVHRTGPNKLGVFVYIAVLDATTEFEPQDLLDEKTRKTLLLARPLPDQYRQFHVDPELDKMYTG
uniref:Chromatin elongation factor spt5 n=1 Tax=Moniliophthora roreri TaxID=221103 RepID=A0A0W0FCX2_MONRR